MAAGALVPHLEEMEETHSLPLELGPHFVQFLEEDERPTVLVDAGEVSSLLARDTLKHWYGNKAFKSRKTEEKFDIEKVLEVLDTAGSGGARTCVVNGIKWGLRALGQRWWALVCHGNAENTKKEASINHAEANGAIPSNEETNNSESAMEKFGAGTQLDWTRHTIPGLSPWIEFVQNQDWASTGVGPMEKWSDSLRSHLITIMLNPMPRLLVWGENMTFLYNEACVPLFGAKHPQSFGQHVSETWSEIWDRIGPMVQGAYQGKLISLQRMPLPINRHGFLEETFWDFNM